MDKYPKLVQAPMGTTRIVRDAKGERLAGLVMQSWIVISSVGMTAGMVLIVWLALVSYGR